MCGVVWLIVRLADTGVIRVTVGVDTSWSADRCDAGVGSLGVEVRGREALALLRGDALASVAAGAADGLADVQLTVVLPAVAADRVIRPS